MIFFSISDKNQLKPQKGIKLLQTVIKEFHPFNPLHTRVRKTSRKFLAIFLDRVFLDRNEGVLTFSDRNASKRL